MSTNTVEEIKARLSITDLVGSYVKLEKAGTNLRARCPFHNERTPSFFVSPARQSFHCFGCGKSGDIFAFLQEIEGLNFAEALNELALRTGVEVKRDRTEQKSDRGAIRQALELANRYFQAMYDRAPIAKEYLEKRGIKEDIRKKFEVGFAPRDWSSLSDALRKRGIRDEILVKSGLSLRGTKGVYDRFRGRIMFPINDYMGRMVGFTGRILPQFETDEEGKYVNTPETDLYHKSNIVYALDKSKQAIRNKNRAILVEGQMDAIMSYQAGVENIVAVSGTAFTEEHLSQIERLADTLVIVLDGDDAGFKASSKAVKMAFIRGLDVLVVPLQKGTDPADVAKNSAEEWGSVVESGIQFVPYALSLIGQDGSSRKEKETLVRERLYPYLAIMQNALARDEAMGQIALALSTSHDSIREDFSRFIKSNPETFTIVNKGSEVKDTSFSRQSIVLERLFGILFWLERTDNKKGIDVESLKKYLLEQKNNQTLSRLLKDDNELSREELAHKQRLAFEAEGYYNNQTVIVADVAHLRTTLERESLTNRLEELLASLRLAEKSGDNEKVKELLILCQDINKALSLLPSAYQKDM